MVEEKPKHQDPLREKVEEYKRAHPNKLPELDYVLFLKSIKRVSELSCIKIARNALSDKREWIPGTETWNVSKIYVNDDHYVVFKVSRGNEEFTVERLFEELKDLDKRLPFKSVPLMIEFGDGTTVKAEDLYAHSLVTSMWAGLPVDIVLCYTQKKQPKQEEKAPEED